MQVSSFSEWLPGRRRRPSPARLTVQLRGKEPHRYCEPVLPGWIKLSPSFPPHRLARPQVFSLNLRTYLLFLLSEWIHSGQIFYLIPDRCSHFKVLFIYSLLKLLLKLSFLFQIFHLHSRQVGYFTPMTI